MDNEDHEGLSFRFWLKVSPLMSNAIVVVKNEVSMIVARSLRLKEAKMEIELTNNVTENMAIEVGGVYMNHKDIRLETIVLDSEEVDGNIVDPNTSVIHPITRKWKFFIKSK
ncbi:hypothetical protein RJT34_26498 [Clitoria ternatea]|uniref:Uncharacterized protein n=1 Tax=Clitoria ternatea TaxID=43366 RepID=A0AAN9I825_CLITE